MKMEKNELKEGIIPFYFTCNSEERRILTLQKIETVLTGETKNFNDSSASDAAPSQVVYLVTGFNPDFQTELVAELIARGHPSFVSDSTIKCNCAIFCLPSKSDEEKEDELFSNKKFVMEMNLRDCKARSIPVYGVKAEKNASWIPDDLDGNVLDHGATADDFLRAFDIPSHPLKIQGDVLEPFRVVSEKARRFSVESGRDSCRVELLQTKTDKILVLTAPSGWGKTTLFAEICRRHSPVVSAVSQCPQDVSETVGALFFFNRLDPSRSKSAGHCLKSISRQLCGTVPGFALDDLALETIEDPSATATQLLDTLIISPALTLTSKSKAPSKRVFVVIDALDECEDVEILQTALNSKWQTTPAWLVLLCSAQTRPTLVAKHFEFDHKVSHNSNTIVDKLVEKSGCNFLWLSVCEPILVNLLEENPPNRLSQLDANLPNQSSVEAAVRFVFERFVDQEVDKEKVRQAYSLATCVPRCFLPVEIYSYCGIEKIPPLLIIEDLCVKPLHAKVLDALLTECGVRLEMTKDHALVSEALEKAYATTSTTTAMAKHYAAAHGCHHARLAGQPNVAKLWFEDFARLYAGVSECVRETGDVLRFAQDGEECLVSEDVVDVIRLSNAAVSFDTREFAGQVIGRLGASHKLSNDARTFAIEQFVKGEKVIVALPNPFFSGLSPARGPLKKVLKHRAPVLAAIESNGFVLTCAGQVAYIWNLNKSEKVVLLKGHSDDIKCCAFGCSPSGVDSMSFIAVTGAADATAKLWQGTFKVSGSTIIVSCVKSFLGHDAAVTCLAYRHPNELVTGSADKTAISWDLNTNLPKIRFRGHTGDVRCVAMNDTIVLTGSHDKTCRIWNVKDGSDLGRLEGHTRDVSSVQISKDGTKVFTGCFDAVARCFDFSSKKIIMEYKGHTQRINAISLSSDGSKLASCSFDGTARLFDTSSGETLLVLKGHQNDVNYIRFSADDSKCITSSLDCETRIWAVTKEKIEKFIKESKHRHDELVTCVGISENFAISGSSDGCVRVSDLKTGMVVSVMAHDESITAVALSSDGTKAISGSEDGKVKVWEVGEKEGIKLFDLEAHQDSIESVVFSEDTMLAKTVSFDQETYTWDLTTGRTIPAGRNHQSNFLSVPTFKKQESRHVLGPNGSSIGFTMDVHGFAVALVNDDDSILPKTFGEIGDLFYLWEWYGKS